MPAKWQSWRVTEQLVYRASPVEENARHLNLRPPSQCEVGADGLSCLLFLLQTVKHLRVGQRRAEPRAHSLNENRLLRAQLCCPWAGTDAQVTQLSILETLVVASLRLAPSLPPRAVGRPRPTGRSYSDSIHPSEGCFLEGHVLLPRPISVSGFPKVQELGQGVYCSARLSGGQGSISLALTIQRVCLEQWRGAH